MWNAGKSCVATWSPSTYYTLRPPSTGCLLPASSRGTGLPGGSSIKALRLAVQLQAGGARVSRIVRCRVDARKAGNRNGQAGIHDCNLNSSPSDASTGSDCNGRPRHAFDLHECLQYRTARVISYIKCMQDAQLTLRGIVSSIATPRFLLSTGRLNVLRGTRGGIGV